MNIISRDTERAVLRSSTAITKLMGNLATASDDDVVRAIDSKLSLATVADTASHQHRLDAGRMLVELRTRVEARGDSWWKWHGKNFARSRRDTERLMALALADNPEAAAQEYRDRDAERQRRKRRAATDVCRIEKIVKLIEALTDQEREELRAACKEIFKW